MLPKNRFFTVFFLTMTITASCSTGINITGIVRAFFCSPRSRRKCDQYWPKEGTLSYGPIEVTLLSEVTMANYTLRQLRVKHRKLKKKKWICRGDTALFLVLLSCLLFENGNIQFLELKALPLFWRSTRYLHFG